MSASTQTALHADALVGAAMAHAELRVKRPRKRNREKENERNRSPDGMRAVFEIRIKHKFGLTVEDWARMFNAQDGRCAICKRALVNNSRTHVDHRHSTGVVRGLLCGHCNAYLERCR